MPKARQIQNAGAASERHTEHALKRILKERGGLLKLRPVRESTRDPIDAAHTLEDEWVWLAVLDRSDQCRAQLGEAMERLAQGRYGECRDCGERITAARLRALPFAIRCISCQEEHEIRQRPGKKGLCSPAVLLWTGTDN